MKKIVFVWLTIMSLVVITGCNSPYRPIWHRENATYTEVNKDSEWCKSRTKTVDLTREEIKDQYERCMKDKGYQLKERKPYSGGPTVSVEQKEGPPIVISKGAKVYVSSHRLWSGYTPVAASPLRYFHKKDCRHVWNIPTEEVTVEKAIADGKSMCPNCFP